MSSWPPASLCKRGFSSSFPFSQREDALTTHPVLHCGPRERQRRSGVHLPQQERSPLLQRRQRLGCQSAALQPGQGPASLDTYQGRAGFAAGLTARVGSCSPQTRACTARSEMPGHDPHYGFGPGLEPTQLGKRAPFGHRGPQRWDDWAEASGAGRAETQPQPAAPRRVAPGPRRTGGAGGGCLPCPWANRASAPGSCLRLG